MDLKRWIMRALGAGMVVLLAAAVAALVGLAMLVRKL